ncbi:progranulin-like isoform X3 [Littorina saxatilis]|uniref:progranulin-like isoform X3 n=1 Tax=Littorina saxatilis TaxID=31220 RepID=UPI0038B64F3C
MTMERAMCTWLMLACCAVLVVTASQDNVLRFVSQKEMSQKPQEKGDDIIIVSADKQKEQPMQKFRAQNILCPNGETQCSGATTCCPLHNGQYGCCDGLNAACCADGVHCCPQGYTCDEQHGQCKSTALGISFTWVDKKVVHAHPVLKATLNVTCKDKTTCEATDTCCNATGAPGKMGCCPLLHAVCCADKAHCCPAGTKCDTVHRRCFSADGNWEQPWVERRGPAVQETELKVDTSSAVTSPVKKVVCPGGGSECPDGNTCCELASGNWGCCPKPNAVCCSDKIHCCPTSYTCDETSGSCKPPQGELFIPWAEKKPATPRVSGGSVTCPDGKTQCADGQTCCQEASGQYGCCPFPQAVCCSDHSHCCPSGFSCNLKAKKCERGQESVSWNAKQPAVPRMPSTVVCPGGQSQCPDGQTCCQNDQGQYACCPSPNATCCSDHVHCCPQGYKCDLATKTCDHSLSQRFPSVPMLTKEPAIVKVNKVICPDQKSECGDGQTCCKMSTGQYGCCPKPNAVCCADHLHCCPQGYTCDTGEGRCNKGLHSLPWDQKQQASLH